MNQPNADLNPEELLHLAIQASQKNDNEKSILYVKKALKQEPENGRLHYFLGAQHADIGMFEEAIEDLKKAVELSPDLETAHFQLGLLFATSSRIEEAEQAWKALDEFEEDNPLLLFKTGLLELVKDNFETARSYLEKGIENNKINPSLNKDMQNILDSTMHLSSSDSSANGEEPKQDNKAQNHIFLSAYNKGNEETGD